MDAAKAFGIAFRVDDETIAKYKTYGIDLAEASTLGVRLAFPLVAVTTAVVAQERGWGIASTAPTAPNLKTGMRG